MNAISKWALALALAWPMAVHAQSAVQPVLQRGYDANVSGANLTETTLNTSNVGPNTFGLLFDLPVDERILAQPLYVPNVAIPNSGSHNVLYVATMNDTVYAFDADTGGAPLWSVNLASLFNTTAPLWANFSIAPYSPPGHLGILSTPVIDLTTNTMYVVACTLENSTLAYRLHAINITTGAEPYGPGVLITGSYGGIMLGTPYLVQRMSLVLAGNQVVFGFSGMQVEQPLDYVGWVMAYDKLTLLQSGVFASVITGNLQGGVWQSGRPPAVDSSGYVYVFTGNTSTGGWNGVTDFSESALKLDPANGLTLVDWFTAGNWQFLDNRDLDLSSSGPLLIPGTSLLAGGGKTGDLYVLDTANLGHWNANDSQVVQKENITAGGEIHGGPAYWEGTAATGGPLLYDWGSGDVLKAYAFNGTTFATSPSAVGTTTAVLPGGFLALSANGTATGSGVLWATTPGDPTASPPIKTALHAFNAENIATELWNTTMNAARDGYGSFATYVPPMVADGKVYMATASNQVAVYGLLSSYTLSPTSLAFGSETTNAASQPMSVTLKNTGTVALPITSVTFSGANPLEFQQTNTCGTSVAVAGTCTISVLFKPTSIGSATAALSVNTGNDAATQSVALSGTGTGPTYTTSPTSVAFGNQLTNVASAPKSVTVTNTGTVALPITSIGLSSAGSQPFSQTNTCGSSVAAAATCTISVVFDPASVGPTAATLSISGGGGAGTQTVALSGTGIVPAVTLAAAPTSITVGSSVTLTWTSSNATTCVASGGQTGDGWAGAKSVNGTAAVMPNAAGTITYTMTCSSGSTSVQASAQIFATSPASSGSSGSTSSGGSTSSSGGSTSSSGGSTSSSG
ncbi:MAG: choice-of-anchor D domain-containing protein, partial [Steroidobacteraceae bacterium]